MIGMFTMDCLHPCKSEGQGLTRSRPGAFSVLGFLASWIPAFEAVREPSNEPYTAPPVIAVQAGTQRFQSLALDPRFCGGDNLAGRGIPSHPSLAGMTIARSVFVGFVVVLALIGAGTRAAGAQDATLPGGMQILVTPYLWLAGIDATIQTPLERAPSVDADVSAFGLLSHLSAVPFMGSIEIRDGPIGLLGDALHVPVGTGITTPRDLFSGGHAGLIANTGTALLLYRALEQPTQYADLGVGFRAWAFTANLTLNPGILPGASANRMATWGDPLIGGRYHIDLPSGFLPNGFGLSAYGDVGGFGVGAHSDWQLIGTIDYTPTPWIDLHLGYRSLNFTYTASGGLGLGFDVHMRGPILAATFKF